MGLLKFYREHTEKTLLPFWERALDHERGGVFTCFNNEGTELLSTDKYTWSQGRMIWLLSRMSEMIGRGRLSGDAASLLAHAGKTVVFLRRHVFLENGNCAYLLTEDGRMKEPIPGAGYDISFYADCFVVLGFAEYARVAGDGDVLEEALKLGLRIKDRLASGDGRSEPYPVPEGYEAHSVSMIQLNMYQELADALEAAGHAAAAQIRSLAAEAMDAVMGRFYKDGLIREMLPERQEDADTLLSRHITPGHSLECMWFVMAEAVKTGRGELIGRAAEVVERAVDLGWDEEYGGLLRYVDREGGVPKGKLAGGRYEDLVRDTWDMKIWWPHSEALYALLLAHRLTGREGLLERYDRMSDYVFRTFPNPDESVGEWIQIRSRQGQPEQKLVALPVKDPYHILRNMLLVIDLLSAGAAQPERE
ncbi:AGE family epimerase/isomerase [Paenibacillus thalictri]|uniref:N-acylglucosamine 2-epimerase n=1 Tax=Paenibacillus thalictri TaxID=2527873 RepID=A0A4Q9DDZ8_9BACL|nr:AGE family epimerase/isomerase [Paenibacillus thalictri]TBL69661.1 N-acylglucosamine 2-epimerase [Paenibacillus thalictri]